MSAIVQVSFHRDRLQREPAALLHAWPTLLDAAVAAARAGADVAVVQASHQDAVLVRDDVEFHFVRDRPRLGRATPGTRPVGVAAPRMTRKVRELAPRLLHIHGLGLPGHARHLKDAVPGVRLLVQDHADALPRAWRRSRMRRAARSYDAVAFSAREQALPFFAAGLLPAGLPVHEVLEGSTWFSPGDPAQARQAAGVHGDPCFAWVGRLDANKDPLTILEAFARTASRFPDPHLWLCYRDAPLLREVRERIADDERLHERTHLLGELPPAHVELLLRGADWLLQGSARESTGYGVIEALACGATPIVTDIPSLRAIVGSAGLLWPPGDVAALEACLISLPHRDRGALRRAAIDRFENALSWDAVGRQTVAAYDAVLAAAPARGDARTASGDVIP